MWKAITNFIDYSLIGPIFNWLYPQFVRDKYRYTKPHIMFRRFVIPQKILRINGKVPWPVHFTSRVSGAEKIQKGILCDPGDNPNIYIQAINGIIMGNNVAIGTGTAIISANHNSQDHLKHDQTRPIKIGNDVTIYANCVVLPGVEIGNNVIIGAGSVVTKDIPSNSVAVGNPCKVIKEKKPYLEDYKNTTFNRKLSKKEWESLHSKE